MAVEYYQVPTMWLCSAEIPHLISTDQLERTRSSIKWHSSDIGGAPLDGSVRHRRDICIASFTQREMQSAFARPAPKGCAQNVPMTLGMDWLAADLTSKR
jgi:hypothetical protein